MTDCKLNSVSVDEIQPNESKKLTPDRIIELSRVKKGKRFAEIQKHDVNFALSSYGFPE